MRRRVILRLTRRQAICELDTQAVALIFTILTNAELMLNERTKDKYWIYIVVYM